MDKGWDRGRDDGEEAGMEGWIRDGMEGGMMGRKQGWRDRGKDGVRKKGRSGGKTERGMEERLAGGRRLRSWDSAAIAGREREAAREEGEAEPGGRRNRSRGAVNPLPWPDSSRSNCIRPD